MLPEEASDTGGPRTTVTPSAWGETDTAGQGFLPDPQC